MVFKCVKGMYQLQKNYRDAFNLEAFIEKYLEECFDKDMYIVGDISSEILRLKGFDTDPKSKNYFGFIDDYLDISCAFGCPHYILKRIRSEEEYAKLERENKPVITEDDRVQIKAITKENFDKESLVLKTTPKGKPNIVIDSKKINQIPKGILPSDLKDDKEINQKKKPEVEAKPVSVTTFVSSSEDFDPSKKEQRFNKNKKPHQEKNQSGNKNQNSVKPNHPQNQNKGKPEEIKEPKENDGFKQNHKKKNKNRNYNNKNQNQGQQ